MKTQSSCYVAVIAYAVLIITVLYLLFGVDMSISKTIFVCLGAFLLLFYFKTNINKQYRSLYVRSSNYKSCCTTSKFYCFSAIIVICVITYYFTKHVDVNNPYLIILGAIFLPVSVYVVLQFFFYQYYLCNHLHVRIIHETCLFLDNFQWSMSSNEGVLIDNDDSEIKSTILLFCHCKHLSINMFTRFLKGKLQQQGYGVFSDLSEHQKLLVIKKYTKYRIIINPTEDEYLYELHITEYIR